MVVFGRGRAQDSGRVFTLSLETVPPTVPMAPHDQVPPGMLEIVWGELVGCGGAADGAALAAVRQETELCVGLVSAPYLSLWDH